MNKIFKADKSSHRCILVFLLCIFICVDMFSQWPQFRGAGRDGISSEKNLLKSWPAEGPKLLWSVDTVGLGFASTAIQDRMIYTTGKRDSVEILTALDLNGKLKWQKVIGRSLADGEFPHSRCTPTVYKNKVYAMTPRGDLACFDAISGATSWKVKIFDKFGGPNDGYAESPLVTDDKIIITPCGKLTTMVALNRLTGETIWRTESLGDTAYFSSPVLVRDNSRKVIFQTTNKHDLYVDCSSGKILYSGRKASCMIPQVLNDMVYQGGNGLYGGTMSKWNPALNNRSVLWTDTIKSMEIAGSAFIGNKVVISALPRGLVCFDMVSGKILCRYDRIHPCNFIVAENMLYCYEDGSGKVYLFNLDGGKFELKGSFKTFAGTGPSIAHLSIANGMLFVRRGRVLMAYDIKLPV